MKLLAAFPVGIVNIQKANVVFFTAHYTRISHDLLGICTGKTMALTMLYQLLPYQTKKTSRLIDSIPCIFLEFLHAPNLKGS